MTVMEFRDAESSARRIVRWSREWGRFASLAFVPAIPDRFSRLYDDFLTASNTLGEESLFLNLGYWKDSPQNIDQASAALARLVATEACLGADDVVIDVGCGFGDQDFLWADEFGPKRIIGVNISAKQVEIATARAAGLGLSDAIEYTHGSASELPRSDGSATKVTALESALHFPSRSQFFDEAFRVLAPGGRLVTADVVPLANEYVPSGTSRSRLLGKVVHGIFTTARQNHTNAAEYREALIAAGFEDVRVYSIRHHVFPQYAEYVSRRFEQPEMKRINPLTRSFFGRKGVALWAPWLDYIVAVADKPPVGDRR
ncbi:methyltransferase domain-containing protein [Nocardia cyriacigeorgica]|uniref:Methyltransferase domain-containing protein n=2 Tax=Nocardia cyriacigeorgica TaxID=135487 RepID=A0ABX0CGP0_9NOCA|nr:methyltransferase domain-containing protein [Nocardia cyriacigeorgica]NEW51927.1 methyltransferase domain-containing protein [Nocardia cyriacigeorgica]NEW55721.1 methyltransferase domain-containing protein [Nocardia cyriacigeorgica]